MLTKSALDLCAKTMVLQKKDLPLDSVYAPKTNFDRMAINEDIFHKHLIENHLRDVEKGPQDCAICTMASDSRLKKGNTENIYDTMSELVQIIIYLPVVMHM